MKVHRLKTWPQYFEAIVNLEKKLEWRENDRGFEINDFLVLDEYDMTDGYSGCMALVSVTHIVHGGNFDMPKTHVAMSIKYHSGSSDEKWIQERLNAWGLKLPKK